MVCQAVTQNFSANEQLLYFTSSSLSSDDQTLFFLSDAGGQSNIWARDLQTGEETQLSDNREGVLKSYVYFRGLPYQGLGKASISLDPQRGLVYYLQGRDLLCASLSGPIRRLATLPPDQMTAFTHVSADGRFLCVPTTDERALEDDQPHPHTPDGFGKPDHDIDARVQAENLSSYLRVFDTQTGEQVLCERVPKAWITHVQFSPTDSGAILYNHEWPGDCGIRRMWLYKNGTHRRLRPASERHSPKDWTCHEMWTPDGRNIVYHGGYDQGPFYVGLVDSDHRLTEIALPEAYKAYGHFTMGNQTPNLLVTDGYYCDDKGQAGYISLCRVNWESGALSWQPLCLHHSAWNTQDAHPHPIFDHHDRYVYFTGTVQGWLKVCRVPV